MLCQENISKEEIFDAQKIIADFIIEFEILYGLNAMTSNVHGHLHLAKQVLQFGPLNKSSVFPFENTFKNTRNLYKGTRNFEGQIAINLERRKLIKVDLKKMNKDSLNPEVKFYIKKYLSNSQVNDKNFLVQSQLKNIVELKSYEIDLLEKFDAQLFADETCVFVSCKAQINKRSFHTLNYDNRFEAQDCHCVEFEKKLNETLHGIIKNFISFSQIKLCVIQILKRKKRDKSLDKLSKECLKYINKFFLEVETSGYELVLFSQIKRRCILIQYEDKIMLTPVNDLDEND